MATIPLMIQQPQFQSPLQQRAAALSLQQLGGQVAIQRQVQQENQLKIQAAQEDQNDQNTIQKAFADAYAKNPDPTKPIDYDTVRAQVAPQVRLRNLQALDSDHLKIQQAVQDLAKSKSETDKNKFANLDKQNEYEGQALAAAMAAPDDQKESVYQAHVNRVKAAGIDTSAYPPNYLGDDWANTQAIGVGYKRKIIDDAKAGVDTQEQQVALAEKQKTKAVQDYQAGVTDDASYQQWKTSNPQVAKSTNAPATYDPAFGPQLIRSTVAPASQPEYDIKQLQLAAMKNLTPETIGAQIDAQLNPADYSNPLIKAQVALANKGAKVDARAAMPSGYAAVQTAIKDYVDHVQHFTQGIAEKQAEAGTQLSIAKTNRDAAQLFQSFTQNTSELDKAAKPIEDTSQKIGDLKSLIQEGSPQAWANIPAKLLSVTTGGQGSGLRMSTPLLDRELGGAGKWQELEGKLQEWSLNPQKATPITDTQKGEIQSIVNALDSKVQTKAGIVSQARKDLIAAPDITTHRNIILGAHDKLQAVDAAAGGTPTSATPARPTSIPASAQAQYNAARKQWRYSTDGGKTWQTPKP